jgi:hypothetical protein
MAICHKIVRMGGFLKLIHILVYMNKIYKVCINDKNNIFSYMKLKLNIIKILKTFPAQTIIHQLV